MQSVTLVLLVFVGLIWVRTCVFAKLSIIFVHDRSPRHVHMDGTDVKITTSLIQGCVNAFVHVGALTTTGLTNTNVNVSATGNVLLVIALTMTSVNVCVIRSVLLISSLTLVNVNVFAKDDVHLTSN